MNGKLLRLQKLFNKDQNTVIIAIDHGMFDGHIPIVRVNWSTVYCFHWNYNDAYTVVAKTVEQAVSEGAEIVLISLTLKTASEERDAKNVEVYCQLKNEANALGIPVIGETGSCTDGT